MNKGKTLDEINQANKKSAQEYSKIRYRIEENSLKVYLLQRIGDINYDEFESKVIVAPNPEEARRLANIKTGDEGKIWNDPSMVACTEVNLNVPSIVCETFNAG